MQRFFDIVFSTIALMLISPLLILTILILRFTGEGEVFYRQRRVGRNGRKFELLKFATMLKNSPNIGTGTVTLKDDPRVLPVGKFLRKSKINELPQLFNIILGDMSIIGPRPQTERCFKVFLGEAQSKIVEVRPGLSGIGSIVFRSEEEMMTNSNNPEDFYDNVIMPYKGKLEVWYVERRNTALYFTLIILTVIVLVIPKQIWLWQMFPTLPKLPKDLVTYFE